MDDVTRYKIRLYPLSGIEPADDGTLVLYSDYTALRARLDAVEKERDASVAKWAMRSGKHAGERDSALADVARLSAQLATSRGFISRIAEGPMTGERMEPWITDRMREAQALAAPENTP